MGNIGLSTVATINVGAAGAVTASSGYLNNLLLYPYRDDGTGVPGNGGGTATGSKLCIGCHNGVAVAMTTIDDVVNGPAGTHPVRWSAANSSTITAAEDTDRPILQLVTTATDFTTADQANAPNLASYPLDDRMDCDSCHRAHDGDVDSSVAATTRDFTLEQAAAGNLDAICSQCHAVYGPVQAQ
jgi:hypothetical protein